MPRLWSVLLNFIVPFRCPEWDGQEHNRECTLYISIWHVFGPSCHGWSVSGIRQVFPCSFHRGRTWRCVLCLESPWILYGHRRQVISTFYKLASVIKWHDLWLMSLDILCYILHNMLWAPNLIKWMEKPLWGWERGGWFLSHHLKEQKWQILFFINSFLIWYLKEISQSQISENKKSPSQNLKW